MKTFALALMAMVLASCAAGPDFALPKLSLGKSWQQPALNTSQPLPERWWQLLADPVLDQLVQQALVNGSDVRIAAARVRQARGLRQSAAATLMPSIAANANAQYSERSSNVANTLANSNDRQSNLFTAGFDASWELDIFGGKRRALEAARAQLHAAQAGLADARLTLAADVVATYMAYRLAEERIRLAQTQVQLQERTVALTQARLAAGDVSGLDSAQARAQLATTRAMVPELRQHQEQARGALAVLVGVAPNLFTLSPSVPLVSITLPAVAPGLPSTLLERRPDIQRAMENWRAANARVGEAQALRLPVFGLTASSGVQSSQLSNLLANGSGFWQLIPQAGVTLLDFGNRRGVVEARRGVSDEAAAQYQQAVLRALRDVEHALASVHETNLREMDLRHAVDHSHRAWTLADALFAAGEYNVLPVLKTQEKLAQSQDLHAQARVANVQAWVALVKALGGGTHATTTTPQGD